MSLVHITPGSRLYVCGLRIHHGLSGCALITAGIGAVIIGAALVADDWPDRWWLNDRSH